MAINIAEIERVLVANGFTFQHATKYYRELIHAPSGESVYLNRAEPMVYSQLIAHPRYLDQRQRLLDLNVGIGSSRELRFGANLKNFPKKVNRGERPSGHGVPFGFDSTAALETFVKALFG